MEFGKESSLTPNFWNRDMSVKNLSEVASKYSHARFLFLVLFVC